MPAMTITRLHADSDGQSHAEQLSLDTHPKLTSLMAAQGVQFRSIEAGHFLDWHPAPRRQFVIMLSGHMEIGLPDGSLHRFGPGDVLLAEDVTGKHTRRVIGDEPRVTATIPLAD